jgi:hypothetical protein
LRASVKVWHIVLAVAISYAVMPRRFGKASVAAGLAFLVLFAF